MKALNFCGVMAGVAVLASVFSSLSVAGPAPAVQTLEGGPIPAGTGNDSGSPLPPASTVPGASRVDSSVANTGGSVLGGNNYGGNTDTATSGVRERGVAGSGLPREKMSVVDTKSLPSKKTDGRFDTSLLGSDFGSVKDVKAVTQKEASKSQAQTEKATSSAKKPERTKTQTSASGDSTKAADKR
jgi:hypothetical protein